ncbi:MAG: hypothetical protein ACE5Q6_05470 [Dehalococcoidia bacterium]
MKVFGPILLGSLGFGTGLLILVYDTDATESSTLFSGSPQFLVWLFAISVLTAFFFIGSLPIFTRIYQLRELMHNFLRGLSIYLVITVVMIALIVVPIFVPRFVPVFVPDWISQWHSFDYPLAHYVWKLRIITLLGSFLVAGPAATGIWLVYEGVKANEKLITSEERQRSLADVEKYVEYGAHLNVFLLILGLAVGMLMLTTGALRYALIATAFANEENFPAALVLVYGAYFTLIVALVYIPTRVSLIEAGRKACDDLLPYVSPTNRLWAQRITDRRHLEELLQVGASAVQSFQAGLAILAPLLSGLVPILLA